MTGCLIMASFSVVFKLLQCLIHRALWVVPTRIHYCILSKGELQISCCLMPLNGALQQVKLVEWPQSQRNSKSLNCGITVTTVVTKSMFIQVHTVQKQCTCTMVCVW